MTLFLFPCALAVRHNLSKILSFRCFPVTHGLAMLPRSRFVGDSYYLLSRKYESPPTTAWEATVGFAGQRSHSTGYCTCCSEELELTCVASGIVCAPIKSLGVVNCEEIPFPYLALGLAASLSYASLYN